MPIDLYFHSDELVEFAFGCIVRMRSPFTGVARFNGLPRPIFIVLGEDDQCLEVFVTGVAVRLLLP